VETPLNLTNCVVKGMNNEVFGVTFNPIFPGVIPLLTGNLGDNLGAIVSDPSCAPTPSISFGICAVIDGTNHLQAIINGD
jgi:hypothetical protein